MSNLITIKNCRIENKTKTILSQIDWSLNSDEAWLIIGKNKSGKADFLNALAGNNQIIKNDSQSVYENNVSGVETVSLERAAHLIQEERENDESDYIEGGVDIGRTGRFFIAQALCQNLHKNEELPDFAEKIETYPAIKLCGVESFLDRGLKYLSTGEIRRLLLARALISNKKLLILSDPFAGLDVQSRAVLLEFFNTIVKNQLKENPGSEYPHLIIAMERYTEIPEAITNVLEFSDNKISFCGTKDEYEKKLSAQKENADKINLENKNQLEKHLSEVLNNELVNKTNAGSEFLVEMNDVCVGWDGHEVLKHINWKLKKGEHWLIQGPNGSGKTTFLELITGDNMQVFSNDVRIFGKRRGSGETIWDIKKRLGIVSYRMHVEYRMLGNTSLRDVIISGFRDSIGLYGAPTDLEIAAAKKWLNLGGFTGRETETFSSLSYGEQRAVLILRSTVKNPEILILDEPCHGLDDENRTKILNLMNYIGNGGTTTMLHVTHDKTEILECEKHVLELLPGKEPMYKIR
ncbi:MAG: ATP-binding cassette domain-containing protein [Treponema sp.]|nr:ATP-binding cassette domain-containing protein [Treponema sp.]